jgi:flagellar biogenesis protein FliO
MSISCAILAPNYESSYYLIMLSLLLVVILAYLTTRFLAKARQGVSRGKNMAVIERLYLSADKHLLIVSVGDEYVLMSQDKSGLKLVKTLENFEPQVLEQNPMKFGDILDKFKNNKDK